MSDWQPFIPPSAIPADAQPSDDDKAHHAAIAQTIYAKELTIMKARAAALRKNITREKQRIGGMKGDKRAGGIARGKQKTAEKLARLAREKQEQEQRAKEIAAAAEADLAATKTRKRLREQKYAVFLSKFDTPVSADETPE